MSAENGTLTDSMTVVALVNGMIGGIILVMPILALKTGYATIAPVVLVSGFFSYYSCLLCLKHLRNYKDLDDAVLKHFNNKKSFKLFYDICISISIIVLLILYFDLICKQWEELTTSSKIIPLLNAIVLFPVIYIMKKYHFGASLLAYGIISTIGYCFFLLYMWLTAPQGQHKLEPVDKHFPELAAALSQGFAIQTFFIPIIKKNSNRHSYTKLLMVTYAIGTLIYLFIGYGGALSIVNRSYPGSTKPQTITQYFNQDQWEVIVLHIIYLIHLYSAFPEFLLISKKRFFSALNWPEPTDVSFKQVIYVGVIILLCLIIKLTNLSADTLIELNGSIVSFIFITIIPIGLHIKCVYFTHREDAHQKWQDEPENKVENENKICADSDQRESEKQNRIQMEEVKQKKVSEQQLKNFPKQHMPQQLQTVGSSASNNQGEEEIKCCDIEYKSRLHQISQSFLMLLMVGSGIATMCYTIYLIYDDSQQNTTL